MNDDDDDWLIDWIHLFIHSFIKLIE